MKPFVVAVAVALLGLPVEASGQSPTDLVRFALEEILALDAERPPFVCVLVKADQASDPRDATPDELPDPSQYDFTLTGASECVEDAGGAYHEVTKEQALILKIGVGEIFNDGMAWFTSGWYRAGMNAGASRCEAQWDGAHWSLGECRPLWIT